MRTPERPFWTARRFYLLLSKALTRGRSSSSPVVTSLKVLCVPGQRAAGSPYQTPSPSFDLISYPHSRVSDSGWELLPFPLSSLTTSNFSWGAGFIRSEAYGSFNSSLPFRFSYSTLTDRGRKDNKEEVLREEKSASSSPAFSQEIRNEATDVQGGGIKDESVQVLDVERQGGSESETGWSREEVLNWPNAISLARLLSGPLLAWMILQGFPRPALVGLALAGVSDWLDGYVARRLGINSVLGSYLDPLADKVLVGCIAVAMAYSSLLHPALVALIVARDGVLLGGSLVYRAYTLRWQWSGWGEFFKIGAGGAEKVEPLFISKELTKSYLLARYVSATSLSCSLVNMVLQLALIGTALVQPALEMQDTYALIPFLSWSVVATTSLSWIGYAWVYLRRPSPAVLVGGVAPLPPRKASCAAKKGVP